jgi:hypothetical protein
MLKIHDDPTQNLVANLALKMRFGMTDAEAVFWVVRSSRGSVSEEQARAQLTVARAEALHNLYRAKKPDWKLLLGAGIALVVGIGFIIGGVLLVTEGNRFAIGPFVVGGLALLFFAYVVLSQAFNLLQTLLFIRRIKSGKI